MIGSADLAIGVEIYFNECTFSITALSIATFRQRHSMLILTVIVLVVTKTECANKVHCSKHCYVSIDIIQLSAVMLSITAIRVSNNTKSAIMLSIPMPTESKYNERYYAKYHYAECHYAECCYEKYHCAQSRGLFNGGGDKAQPVTNFIKRFFQRNLRPLAV